jgi:hypothetical protein
LLISKTVHHSIINPDWDFQNMGVGGLDTEFNAIFRRAFASRVFPPEIVEQLGKMSLFMEIYLGTLYEFHVDLLLRRLQTRQRYSSLRPARNRKNSDGAPNWKNVERP